MASIDRDPPPSSPRCLAVSSLSLLPTRPFFLRIFPTSQRSLIPRIAWTIIISDVSVEVDYGSACTHGSFFFFQIELVAMHGG